MIYYLCPKKECHTSFVLSQNFFKFHPVYREDYEHLWHQKVYYENIFHDESNGAYMVI